jgi:hypothetical protein
VGEAAIAGVAAGRVAKHERVALMQKLLAIISAAAGAIVGLVKIVDLITGSDWLGDNWKTSLGYVAVAFIAVLGAVYLVMAMRPQLVRSGEVVLSGVLSEVFVPARARKRWVIVLVFVFAGLFMFACAFAMTSIASQLWWAGIGALAYAVLMAGLVVWRRRKESTKCPYCLQTISVTALVCHHCMRNLTTEAPEDGEPDLIWL